MNPHFRQAHPLRIQAPGLTYHVTARGNGRMAPWTRSTDTMNVFAPEQQEIIAFLSSLVLFPPDDTASNLDPGDPTGPGFPQFGHGSIRLTVLFNDPTKVE